MPNTAKEYEKCRKYINDKKADMILALKKNEVKATSEAYPYVSYIKPSDFRCKENYIIAVAESLLLAEYFGLISTEDIMCA